MRAWILENRDTYFANPTARRDFRTQLRGVKPALLWSGYLLLLIFVGMTFYAGLESDAGESLADLQRQLKQFYAIILSLLAGAVTVIAPALTASSVAAERQRRSLDLVLSTPLHIKSYLVGKLIASYRYTWMLLILSLPLVSMCVIMGGATWMEVIVAYVRLSLFGLFYTAIGLLMSVLAPRPVSAIAYSYIAVAFFAFLTALVAGIGATGGPGTGFFALASLNPFFDSVALVSGNYVESLLVAWLPLAIFVAAACKVLLLGAGSALNGFASVFTRNLRLHILAITILVFGFLASQLPNSVLIDITGMIAPSSPTLTPGDFERVLAVASSGMLCYAAILLHWLIPFAACYSPYAERRFHNDGTFNAKRAFLGTPSGALPYLLLLVAASVASILVVFWYTGSPIEFRPFFDGVLWCAGFVTLVWAACRFVSSFSRNLSTARGGTYVLLVCLLLLPTPVLQAMAEIDGNSQIWRLHPFYSALGESDDRFLMAITMLILATIFVVASAKKRTEEPAAQRTDTV